MIQVHREQKNDWDDVRSVNHAAFGQPDEAHIVDKVRESGKETLSLVALFSNTLVGHILFSPVTIERRERHIRDGKGLAPMAVLPEFQNRGISSKLVQEGIRILKKRRCPFVVVLGHASYYPRFGFLRASQYRLKCQWKGVPDEAFTVMILNKAAMAGVSGVVKYGEEFNEAD